MNTGEQSELVDQVSELDEPIGTISRSDVFKEKAGFRVVHIYVFDGGGKLLLEHLGDDAYRSKRKWGSSVAGYVHAGETYAKAARRRLYQELGIATDLRKLGAVRMHDEGATKFIELFTTTAELNTHEGTEDQNYVQWFELDEIERHLKHSPQIFTETFPHVYRLFGAADR